MTKSRMVLLAALFLPELLFCSQSELQIAEEHKNEAKVIIPKMDK